MATKILIVEDEKNISRLLQLELEHEGYETQIAADGLQALTYIQDNNWDLILLDIMLPGLSGMEVLRRLRMTDPDLPVIMLTARDTVVDKVSGLDQGANDYITKPFEIEELLARIRVSLRMNPSVERGHSKLEEATITFANLTVNTKSRDVKRDETFIELTAREYDLLLFLLEHQQQVMSREQILEQVWGYDYFGDTNIVDVYIRYLRQKVDKPFDKPIIHTVRGVGYVLKEKNQ
ncbi:PhoB family transcriptional regulator [Alkalihalobacillus alcalophilus ATCC 27647 = CGMCC 1.3604]|uniref:PhoB family transcriptional regulator n=1 Tax=Alkalihalobacillus alcalophilus ATCC 27647 = CGMCC 1.3604 TaxID=1218173 RepID=A0A094YW39_ALKAL|nr:response regulator transcription factor [Alkalihalobacillus alcalophilus]KGA97717.1 PhoB family transcriptional regulator [Alkalihalobacillus alcalophilus ATCC 27647 = CGMCC 1.3604]MED1562597.1 response regulator transcription factor [Alkalihalobacillus alcalophilus]THG91250.1 PhoB family transcriptional regulator [Alkalihalobacillus alcalophilus ATCC 27647 = CGMCC 1.3604]